MAAGSQRHSEDERILLQTLVCLKFSLLAAFQEHSAPFLKIYVEQDSGKGRQLPNQPCLAQSH